MAKKSKKDNQANAESENAEATNPEQAEQQAARPKGQPFNFLIQYIKDVSFESPLAPEIFKDPKPIRPHFDIDVETTTLGGRDILVEIKLEVRGMAAMDSANSEEDQEDAPQQGNTSAETEVKTAYIAEMTQACVLRINEVPKEAIASIAMVEAPTLLYPFLRTTAINLIREGGFNPPRLPLINFLQLAKNKAEKAQKEQADNKAD